MQFNHDHTPPKRSASVCAWHKLHSAIPVRMCVIFLGHLGHLHDNQKIVPAALFIIAGKIFETCMNVVRGIACSE